MLRPRPRGQWEETTVHDLPDLYGIPTGERYRELAALRGDPSDGLSGAKGIGEKTAAKLLAGYGSLDNVFDAAKRGVKDHGLSPKRRDNLLAAEHAVRKNVQVMTVLTDLDVSNLIESSATITPNVAGLDAFAQRYGVERSISRLTETFTSHAPQTAPPTSWADEPLFAFDLETTGRDPHTAHIVSAALIDMRTNETWEWLVYPEDDIPAEATAVHGITTEFARAHGTPRAQAIAHMHAVVSERTPACIVAHNAPYDLTIFARECAQQDLRIPDLFVIDTLVIDKQAEQYRKGPRTLDAVCKRWGISLDNAHDATADARASGLVALAIADAFPDIAQLSAEQIHHAQKDWKREQAARLQEYLRTRRDPNAVVDHEWPFLTRGER
nr:exonuclease domain-containing protein [Brevibacterium sp. ACRRH]